MRFFGARWGTLRGRRSVTDKPVRVSPDGSHEQKGPQCVDDQVEVLCSHLVKHTGDTTEESKEKEMHYTTELEEMVEEESTVRSTVSETRQKFEDSSRCQAELQERLDAILALRTLVSSQRKTISSLRKRHRDYKRNMKRKWQDSTTLGVTSEVSGFQGSAFGEGEQDLDGFPRKYSVSFGPTPDKTDVDVMGVIDHEGTDTCDLAQMGGEFQEAVEAIQKQASQMDTAIALDQLDTTKEELERVTRKLENRTQELEDVKQQLKGSQRRLANVEQQRDLFEAEAMKSKEDLESCIAYMSKLGLVPPGGNRAGNASDNVITPEKTDDHSISSNGALISRSKTVSILPSERGDSTHRKKKSDWSPYGDGNETPPSVEKQKLGSIKSKNFGLFRFQKHRHTGTDHAKVSKRHKHEPIEETLPVQEEKDSHEDDGLTCVDVKQDTGYTHSFVRSKTDAEQLNSRSLSSTATAEELRKRLDTVSRFYEKIVCSLQRSVVDLKTEKSRLEVDLASRVSSIDHEKRAALETLKSKLRDRDARIAQLEQANPTFSGEEHFFTPSYDMEEPTSPPRFC